MRLKSLLPASSLTLGAISLLAGCLLVIWLIGVAFQARLRNRPDRAGHLAAEGAQWQNVVVSMLSLVWPVLCLYGMIQAESPQPVFLLWIVALYGGVLALGVLLPLIQLPLRRVIDPEAQASVGAALCLMRAYQRMMNPIACVIALGLIFDRTDLVLAALILAAVYGLKLLPFWFPVAPAPTREVPESVLKLVEDLSQRMGIPAPKVEIVGSPDIFEAHSLTKRRLRLTESLVKTLSERELQTVLAHELAHLKRRDPLKFTVLNMTWALLPFLPLWLHLSLWLIPFAVIGGYLLVAMVRHRVEYRCDAEALAVCQSPREQATALARLTEINWDEFDRPWWRTIWLTHPNTADRVRRIAKGRLAPGEVETLFDDARQNLPARRALFGRGGTVDVSECDRVVLRGAALRAELCTWLCLAPLGVAAALAVKFPADLWPLLAGGVAGLAAVALTTSWVLPKAGARRAFAILDRNLPQPPAQQSWRVGFAPGTVARLRPTSRTQWEPARLSVEEQALVVEGAEFRVCLRRSEVLRLLWSPARAWTARPSLLALEVCGQDGEERRIQLSAITGNWFRREQELAALRDALARWLRQPASADRPAEAGKLPEEAAWGGDLAKAIRLGGTLRAYARMALVPALALGLLLPLQVSFYPAAVLLAGYLLTLGQVRSLNRRMAAMPAWGGAEGAEVPARAS